VQVQLSQIIIEGIAPSSLALCLELFLFYMLTLHM